MNKWFGILASIFLFETCFCQKNVYLSPNIGLGYTLVKVNHHEDLPYKNLKSAWSPSFQLGIDVRYDFNNRFSGSLGTSILNYGYGTTYKYKSATGENKIKNFDAERYLTIPFVFRTLFEIQKERHLFLTLSGGIALGIKVGDLTTGILYGIDEQGDSLGGAVYILPETNSISINIIPSIGLEKRLKSFSRIGFSLDFRVGVLKTYEGELYYYNTPIPLSIFNSNNLPTAQPAEFSEFFSRNTSFFITFYYAIDFKNKKE